MQWDGINRRRFIRLNYPFTIHIYLPGKPAISTYTEDISEGGVKVTIKEDISQVAAAKLEIYLRAEPVVCEGKVQWVKERVSRYLEGVKLYDTGIEFSQVNPADRKIIKGQVEEVLKVKQEERDKNVSEGSQDSGN